MQLTMPSEGDPMSDEEVAQRLDQARVRGGLSQAELARKLERPLQTVNDWFGKGRIPQDQLARVAELLDCDVKWLLLAEGEPPRWNSDAERSAYRAAVGWGFVQADEDGNENHGNSNVFTVPADVDTLVRETGQNITDNAVGGPAEAIYRLIELTGQDRTDFEASMQWAGGLRPHVEAASKLPGKFGRRLTQGLAIIGKQKTLTLLRIEDRKTAGLTGAERRKEGAIGHFIRLCRGDLMSEKSSSSGGSFGLGSCELAVLTCIHRFVQ